MADELHGQFPDTLEGLCELPGVGRSTAGAILSIAFGQRASILDGNVKRVLARYHRVEGWPGQTAVHQRLWDIAEQYTPNAALRRLHPGDDGPGSDPLHALVTRLRALPAGDGLPGAGPRLTSATIPAKSRAR